MWWPVCGGMHFGGINKGIIFFFFYLLKYHKIAEAPGLQPTQPSPKSGPDNCLMDDCYKLHCNIMVYLD